MATAETSGAQEKRLSIKSLTSKLAKMSKGLEVLLTDKANATKVTSLRADLKECLNQYTNEVTDLNGLPATDQATITDVYTHASANTESLFERADDWLKQCASVKSSKAGSHASSKSSTIKRQLAEQKIDQVKRRQQLERRQRDLNAQQAAVRDELELEALNNQLQNSETEDSDSSDTSSLTSDSYNSVDNGLPKSQINANEKVRRYVKTMNPEAQPYEQTSHDTDLLSEIKNMSARVQEGISLPKPELLTFNGNPADYCKFIRNFEVNIEYTVKDERLRLSYLIQFCQGDARKSIEDCVILPSVEGYARAKQILASRYGKSHLIARSHIERLTNGNAIRPNDVQGLLNLSLDME